MGTRALTGFRKDGKYYMTHRGLDGGYFVAGAEILKCYINNTKDDFEKAFSMIDFKDEPNYGNTKEDAITEDLFCRKYNLSSENLITLINTKNIELSSKNKSPFAKYSAFTVDIDEEVLVYKIKGVPQIIPYDKVNHLNIEDEKIGGKLGFINHDIFGSDNCASYMYIYDFDTDSLECYHSKSYKFYKNKEDKKEICLKDNKVFRFINTFTFNRDSRLRKYLELFESWFFVEKAFDIINEGEDESYIEEIVESNIDAYLEAVSEIRNTEF